MKKIFAVFSLSLMAALNQVQAQPAFLTNGLVAYYPFNGNAVDATGNGNNITNVTIGYGADRFGVSSSALVLDRSLYATNEIYEDSTSARTVSEWVKINNFPDVTGTYWGPKPSAPYVVLPQSIIYPCCLGADGEFWLDSGSAAAFFKVPVTTNWMHISVVYTGDISTAKVYCNGTLIPLERTVLFSSFAFPSGNYAPFSFNPFAVGGGDWGPGASTNNFFDDYRVYNRALSSNEVAALYAYESTPTLQLTQDLTNNAAVLGQNTTLSVQATNYSSPMNYQWYWQPANAFGQQAGAYAQTVTGFVYGAVVTNGGFGYGNIPGVSFSGGGGSGGAGYGLVSNGVVTGITVTNAGSGYSSLPTVVIDPPNGLLLGQTNSSFTITNASENSLGQYFCVASSSGSSVTSSVINLVLLYPPGIAINPVGFTGAYFGSNSLSVAAAGTPPFRYQWALNGTNILNATNASYPIARLTLTNTGAYTVTASSPYGSVTSSVANVYLAPTLSAPFSGTVALWGQDTTLSVGAMGSGSLSYQWYLNGQPIAGATGSSYGLGGIQLTNAGLYSVVVSSAYGSVTNAAYQVVVNAANVDLGIYPAVGITGTIGYAYLIQSSTDLGNTNGWVNETNLILSAPYQKWSDYSGLGAHKFYRVVPGQ